MSRPKQKIIRPIKSQENHNLNKRWMTWQLSDKQFNTGSLKMFQEAITYSLEKNRKISVKRSEEIKTIKRTRWTLQNWKIRILSLLQKICSHKLRGSKWAPGAGLTGTQHRQRRHMGHELSWAASLEGSQCRLEGCHREEMKLTEAWQGNLYLEFLYRFGGELEDDSVTG